MKNIKRVTLAGVACAAVAVPAIALAANPVKGGHYSDQRLTEFVNVSTDGKSAKLKDVFPGKCNHGIPVEATKPADISGGKLTYSGPAKELATANGMATLTVSGKFVTSDSLKWTVHVKAGSCSAKHSETLTLMKKS